MAQLQGRPNHRPSRHPMVNDELKLLGITFNSSSAILTSWRERISKLEKCLNAWQHRELSLQGKVLTLNTLGLSGLMYPGLVHPTPFPCLQLINKIIFSFLWSGKTEMINRVTLFFPRDRGGLGIKSKNQTPCASDQMAAKCYDSPYRREMGISCMLLDQPKTK